MGEIVKGPQLSASESWGPLTEELRGQWHRSHTQEDAAQRAPPLGELARRSRD